MISQEYKDNAMLMYRNLSKTAKKIVNNFKKTLNISEEDAINLITSNKTAITFLFLESTLILYGEQKSMELLMKVTLFRTSEYNKAITDDEIKRVKKYYDISINRQSLSRPGNRRSQPRPGNRSFPSRAGNRQYLPIACSRQYPKMRSNRQYSSRQTLINELHEKRAKRAKRVKSKA